jgi:formate-dependent nitrite reductase membrane component NrfD
MSSEQVTIAGTEVLFTARENLSDQLAGNATYYDQPLLKKPVWSWEIPLYYYVGGTAGASLVLGAAAQLDSLVRRCHWAGIIGSSVAGGLVISDLGRPERFLNMLRVFRPTSPMNMGAWILSGAAPAAIAAGLFRKRSGVGGTMGELCGFVSGLFGLALSTYTGVLVAHTAVPVWQQSRRILPILFGASAMASAGSIFDMLLENPRERRVTYTFGMLGRTAELAASVAMEREVARVPRVARPLRSGTSGFLWKAATVLTGASLVTSLLPKRTRKTRVIAGVLGTAGSLALRYAVAQAGEASARDPQASFLPQRSPSALTDIPSPTEPALTLPSHG